MPNVLSFGLLNAFAFQYTSCYSFALKVLSAPKTTLQNYDFFSNCAKKIPDQPVPPL